jgi:DNA-directed RNA polymerase subunit RPC12/RpoP
VLVCSLCESNSFYMVLNDEKQIACSECGYLTTLNWKTKKPSP